MLIVLSAVFLLLTVLAGFLPRLLDHFGSRAVRTARRAVLGATAFAIAGLLVGAAGVLRRHFGEWRPLRDALRIESRKIAQRVSSDGVLSGPLSYELSVLYERRPIEFSIASAKEPVRVRILYSQFPYVGLYFGSGQNAVFDPDSMWCIYTD